MADTMNMVKPKGAQPKGKQGRSSAPRQRDADQTRESILTAAVAEFADKGLSGARVDDIARQTATSKHMIYYYFGSKDGLYREVIERVYANFGTTDADIHYASLPPVEALTTLVSVSFDYHVNHPEYVRILMSENINYGEHIKQISSTEARRRLALGTLDDIITRGVATGQFRTGLEALHVHMTISALSFYYVSNRFTFGHIFNTDHDAPSFIAARKAAVIDAVLSLCRA